MPGKGPKNLHIKTSPDFSERIENMAKIGIITDSTCDIPEALLEHYGIIVIPQVVIWGEEQYRDRIDLQPAEFYRRLAVDPVRPHSSLPSLGNFQEAFETAISRGADQLVVLTVSSAMSGTYDMARTAAQSYKVPVVVVDSKGPTMTLGWQVLAAARAREFGADVDSILKQVEQVRGRLVQLVAMESLQYLQTGGRIGDAARWAGTLLRVKPLVSINHTTGRVQPEGLARTHSALVELLYKKFFEALKGGKNFRIAVLHGNVQEQAQALAERIRVEFAPVELLINITGPVLGINTGPGALALCGYAEE
jgi:DegV family protein with EDD domain